MASQKVNENAERKGLYKVTTNKRDFLILQLYRSLRTETLNLWTLARTPLPEEQNQTLQNNTLKM